MLGFEAMRVGTLEIAQQLHDFVADEALPGTGVNAAEFWAAFESIVADLGPRNAALLARRDELQAEIDDWHRAARADGREHSPDAYADFLRDIGYLRYVDGTVTATTANVDAEIAEMAGPQLVVPLDNARYALNAANARWGSLYDALYGTDVIDDADGCARGLAYNPIRGDKVVAAGRDFLDRHFALDSAAHAWVTDYRVDGGTLQARSGDGTASTLLRPEQLAGYTGDPAAPASILLRKNGLHCEVCIDRDHPVGRHDHAGVFDIRIESATTVIMDFEDSVSAVDAEDKVVVYRNWLGLMKGTLAASFEREDGTVVNRSLRSDRQFTDADGKPLTLPGRSLMLVRNVGPHLTADMVTLGGEPVYETMIDAMVSALCGMHDLRGQGRIDGRPARNSEAGSVYIVKPKMHGPDEVALACELFKRVEDALGLVRRTLKMGIMDEERRTSLGLKESIAHARDRVVFINTGFLDRTGDEIHTDMEAGPVIPKAEMKTATWLGAYENSNVDTGLACGLRGRAQIGKGMWTMPGEMAAMVKAKIQHPIAGGEHGMGAFADRGHAPRHALLPGGRRRPPARPGRPHTGPARLPDRHPGAAGRQGTGPRRDPTGARQQRPGHPRVRGSLGGPGDRLLHRARHRRHRPDGGPGHAADLEPAHRQLAPPRRRHRGPGARDPASHGEPGRPAEQRRPGLRAHGARLRRQHPLPGGRRADLGGPH